MIEIVLPSTYVELSTKESSLTNASKNKELRDIEGDTPRVNLSDTMYYGHCKSFSEMEMDTEMKDIGGARIRHRFFIMGLDQRGTFSKPSRTLYRVVF